MKPTKDITGICPIIATPFTPDGEVDYDSLVNLLRSLAKGGCDGLTLFGIAGEYYKLNDAESRRMVEITVRECRAAGVPSIISVTEHSTKLAAEQAREWQAAGADCLMLLPPFFLKPGAAAIRAHIAAVARAVDIPIMVQYAPEQTGVGIDPAVFATLIEYPWPGNVRELEHVVQRAVIYCRDGRLHPSHLPHHVVAGNAGPTNDPTVVLSSFEKPLMVAPAPEQEIRTLGNQIALNEKEIIEQTLFKNSFSRTKTAKELGVSRVTLYNKMKKYGLQN